MLTRRHLLSLFIAAICSALAFAGTAFAQPYPAQPIKLIVPFAAGGPLDLVGRSLGDKLAASLRQPVIIENRVGAGGNIGTEAAAKAPPDGHTLLLVLSGTLVANPAVFKTLPFDPARDFEPISLLTETSQMLVVHPSVPVSTAREFRRLRQETPDHLRPCRARQRRPPRNGLFRPARRLHRHTGALSRQCAADD